MAKQNIDTITFKLNKKDKEKAQQRADREFKTLSELCRQTICEYGKKEKLENEQ